MNVKQADDGFTLIELLLVIVVLGILSTVVVYSVFGITTEAHDSACDADAKVLVTAIESYFAQTGSQVIIAADASLDGVENTLVADGFLRAPSALYDIDSPGALVQVVDSPCVI